MLAFRLLLPAALGLLLWPAAVLAQTYSAGVGAGTSGSFNVFVGAYAGRSTLAVNNSFLGYTAGFNNRTGTDNSFVGYVAGYNNTSGASNSFMGSLAGFQNATGSNNSFMGFAAGAFQYGRLAEYLRGLQIRQCQRVGQRKRLLRQ
jgi:hypothetical protein